MIRDRLVWSLLRRFFFQKKIKTFAAHWSSYVSSNCTFEGHNNVARNVELHNCHLGRFSFVSADSCAFNARVGRFCSVGESVRIGGFRRHPVMRKSTHPCFYSPTAPGGYTFARTKMFDDAAEEVSIGNDVWIGTGSSIMDGITVANGAIIAANALVTRNVPPYAIVGGVPASIIRYRFDTEEIAKLEDEAWWNLPLEALAKEIASFQRDYEPSYK